ncbi:hypothetical protein MRX96_024621 [Rhipicephalus microplus]
MSWTAGDRLFHWSRFHRLGGACWASSEGSQLLLALTDLTSDDVELTAAAVWTINHLVPEDVDCRQRRPRRTWSWQRSWQRSSQVCLTSRSRPPDSSSREANDAKPPVAVVGHSAPCTSASSMPACSYAYNKLPHKLSVLENEGRNGPAMTRAVLNKRHADPAIKQPGVPKYNRWDEPSVSTSGQPYLTTHGKGTPRHVSHQEADQRQCKPAAESFRNDFCSRQTDSTNAGSSSIHQHRTIPGRPSKPSPGVKPSLPYSSKARHDRPAAATVTTGIDHQYALNLHKSCPSLPPVEDIAKRLKDLQRSLTMFNRIFSETNIEVKEEEPRKFSVCFLDGIERSDHNRTFNACILLHILLTRHKCVQSLLLDKRTIANRFPEILCDALACNRGLKHLAIDCWDISPGYEHTLVSSFCKMPARIETIAVSNLSMGPSEAARIGEMVAKTESVRIIKFLENGMPPGAGTELMKGVCRNGSLELIWLRGNAIGFGGARILGEYLSTSLKLRDLSLSHVPCFDEGQLVLIAEGLKTNRSLETLKIEYCHVTPTGIDTLAEVLKTNSTLKNLAVSACGLAQTAARSLGILLAVQLCPSRRGLEGQHYRRHWSDAVGYVTEDQHAPRDAEPRGKPH